MSNKQNPMEIMMFLIKLFKRLFSLIAGLNSQPKRLIFYRLIEINIEKQIVILQIINKNIVFKISLAEAVSSLEIIERLSSQHACWLGLYHGKTLRSALEGKTSIRDVKKFSYLLKHEYGIHKMTHENRYGTIGYINIHTKQQFITEPLALAQFDIINTFDPSQACYIGILAGISLERNLNNKLLKRKPVNVPYLRLVK